MSSTSPLPIPYFLEALVAFSEEHTSITGISSTELKAVKAALRGESHLISLQRGVIDEDHYAIADIHVYIESNRITFVRGVILVCASEVKAQLWIRGPRKHPKFDVEIETVLASAPLLRRPEE